MNNSTKSVRRPTIALALPKSVPALISYAQSIVKRMTDNPSFPNPSPTLAAVTAAIDELQIAETQVPAPKHSIDWPGTHARSGVVVAV